MTTTIAKMMMTRGRGSEPGTEARLSSLRCLHAIPPSTWPPPTDHHQCHHLCHHHFYLETLSRSLGIFYPTVHAGPHYVWGRTFLRYGRDNIWHRWISSSCLTQKKKTPDPTPPPKKTPNISQLEASEICFWLYLSTSPGKSVNQGWLGSSGYRSAALWQPPSSLLPLRAGHIPQPRQRLNMVPSTQLTTAKMLFSTAICQASS